MFNDMALVNSDGTVVPIYSRQKSMALTATCDSGVSDCWAEVRHPQNAGWAHFVMTTYYHGDHLGSSRQITSYDGFPVWEATYLPFGQEHSPPGATPSPAPGGQHYKFTGKERDSESGLDYFSARYYASTTGRFLSPDEFTGGPVDAFSSSDPLPPGPLPYALITNPQSLNKYSYTWNNPLRFTDPDGHFIDTLLDIGSIVYSASAVVADVITGSDQLKTDLKALGGDLVGVAVPGLTGVGAAIRAANKVDNVVDAVRATDKAVDAVKGADKAADASKAASNTAEAISKYKPGADFSRGTKQQAAEKAAGKCQTCSVETVPGQKHQKGVTPPRNEGQTDHLKPKSKGGTNDPCQRSTSVSGM